MLLQKTITANHRYTGDTDGYYQCGRVYHITVGRRRRLWKKYVEVTYRRGFWNERYNGSPVIVYETEDLFREDWEPVETIPWEGWDKS